MSSNYKDSLNLPSTDFPMRANLADREPDQIERWDEEDVYERMIRRREEDILDVWFDSGVSWAVVLEHKLGIEEPADLYLEGSDQHRGWFQSSLLTSVLTRDRSPYRTCLTHGFVTDEEGHKYSKSSQNFEPPEEMISDFGAETLRLWVASVDYHNDVALSPEILDRTADAYRKIRNTFRFMLGNLSDFDPARVMETIGCDQHLEGENTAGSDLLNMIVDLLREEEVYSSVVEQINVVRSL